MSFTPAGGKPSLLEVVVPLRWSGQPYADGSVPLAWLGSDGFELAGQRDANGAPLADPPEGAARFRFRARFTMRDRAALPRAIDEINGGPHVTHDIETTQRVLRRALEAVYAERLWPDEDPEEVEALSPDERRERDRQVDAELARDLARRSDEIEDEDERQVWSDAVLLQRTYRLESETAQLAEMQVLLEDPKLTLAEVEWEQPYHLDALIAAYQWARARSRRERQGSGADPGNVSRSAA